MENAECYQRFGHAIVMGLVLVVPSLILGLQAMQEQRPISLNFGLGMLHPLSYDPNFGVASNVSSRHASNASSGNVQRLPATELARGHGCGWNGEVAQGPTPECSGQWQDGETLQTDRVRQQHRHRVATRGRVAESHASQSIPEGSVGNVTLDTAIMVEVRAHKMLLPVTNHMLQHLPNKTVIQLFHGSLNKALLEKHYAPFIEVLHFVELIFSP